MKFIRVISALLALQKASSSLAVDKDPVRRMRSSSREQERSHSRPGGEYTVNNNIRLGSSGNGSGSSKELQCTSYYAHEDDIKDSTTYFHRPEQDQFGAEPECARVCVPNSSSGDYCSDHICVG